MRVTWQKILEVVDHRGNVISPDSIDWSKLSRKYFPYVLRQMDGWTIRWGSQINFQNKFSVYLHDTNNRSLFSNSNLRAEPRLCARAGLGQPGHDMIRNDPRPEMRDSGGRPGCITKSSACILRLNRVPIYIRYFTAEMRGGRLQFYEDVYGEDKTLEKYFR